MAEGKEREFDIVKNERGKSEIWKHFGVEKMKVDGSIEDSTAVCFSCQSSVKTGGGGGGGPHIKSYFPPSKAPPPITDCRREEFPTNYQIRHVIRSVSL